MRSFVSLFSGAGGLDLGLELAGWDCLLATDNEPNAIATLQANRGFSLGQGRTFLGQAAIKLSDICHLSGSDILGLIGRRKGEVPLLAGGPPCQSWSSGGLQRGFDDPRGQLVEQYLRIASAIEPRWLVFENVRGLLTARGRDGIPGSALASIRSALLSRGWQTKVSLLNAADFGIAQRRVRLILLGYRDGDEPCFPAHSHCETSRQGEREWTSLRKCLTAIDPVSEPEINRPSGKMALDLSGIRPGSGVKSPGKAEATRPGGHWGYKQGAFVADLDRPGRTVTASSQQDWIVDPVHGLRRLSPRECAAIQSFPKEWQFVGNLAAQYRLIGNAVPPGLARAIGESLASSVQNKQTSSTSPLMLNPLPPALQSAIAYTMREESRNGQSRRAAISKRIPRKTMVAS
jgi:DNA (cytosine-5)-methyltransferase 1